MESAKVTPLAANQPRGSVRARAAHLGPERRRPLILDAALEVYVERGYRGTSMQAIADAAGVTKPVIYECFPNKDELLLALLDREERRLLVAITESLPTNLSLDNVEAVLAAGFTAFLAGVGQAPNSWRVVFRAGFGSDSVVARRVRRVREMVVGQLRELVRQNMVALGVDDIDRKAPVVAELIATVSESCARMLVLENHPWTAVDLATYLAGLLTHGVVGTRPASP